MSRNRECLVRVAARNGWNGAYARSARRAPPGGKVSGTPSKSVTESRRIGERPAEPIELTFEVRLP